MAAQKVTGYLATDDTFFNDESLCRHHDAKLALSSCIQNSMINGSILDEHTMLRVIDLYLDQVLEYILARKEVPSQQLEEQHEPDTGPIEVEK
jgi:hypothetical protein